MQIGIFMMYRDDSLSLVQCYKTVPETQSEIRVIFQELNLEVIIDAIS